MLPQGTGIPFGSSIQGLSTINSEALNKHFNPQKTKLSLEERFKLCRSVAEECLSDSQLMKKLEQKEHPICYDGFEPSGRMHIAQGLLKVINVNKLVDSGCIFIFWVADWFAMLNNKLGGDLKKIQTVGRYFIEIWKAAGMKLHNVKFLWASEEINKNPNDYWIRVMDIASRMTQNRANKCATIMGKKKSDKEKNVAQMMYSCMQAADVFFLKTDICQLGKDQRKVNTFALEYAKKIGQGEDKPVILSHHMLAGLKGGPKPQKQNKQQQNQQKKKKEQKSNEEGKTNVDNKDKNEVQNEKKTENETKIDQQPKVTDAKQPSSTEEQKTSLQDSKEKVSSQQDSNPKKKSKKKKVVDEFDTDSDEENFDFKMSKSDPMNAIFMEDGIEDVKEKIKKAFCEMGNVDNNPCLEYLKFIVFELQSSFTIERSQEEGGNITFNCFEDVEKAFLANEFGPLDLKMALAGAINNILKPVREHFENNAEAKQLLEEVKSFRITTASQSLNEEQTSKKEEQK